jgi:hypothetical protein
VPCLTRPARLSVLGPDRTGLYTCVSVCPSVSQTRPDRTVIRSHLQVGSLAFLCLLCFRCPVARVRPSLRSDSGPDAWTRLLQPKRCSSPAAHATIATAVTMEIARFQPAWLAKDLRIQMKLCPYHPRVPPKRRGDYGPGWRCRMCSRCLPVREILMAKLMHHPFIEDLHLHCLFFLNRQGLGKLCQTARTRANHLRIDVANLDPATAAVLTAVTSRRACECANDRCKS